jgi:hypothetical protein
MRMIAGSIIGLAAAIIYSAALVRSGSSQGRDYDLVPMSMFLALLIGVFGLCLILSGMWYEHRSPR